jgi:EmrB/QacA subfamily drug resistance transporter
MHGTRGSSRRRGRNGHQAGTRRESLSTAARPALASRTGRRQPWTLLVLLSMAQFMVILDATVVNVALPSIARSLGFDAGGLQWVVTAYVLASGGLVLLGGRAADVIGRRGTFLAGLTVFIAASLASGLAPDPGAMIAARFGQGAGAALLTPAALSIITTTYNGAQRARALGIWGAIGGAGAAAGVLAGGMLTTWLGWRAVFLVNVPVGVAAGLVSLRVVPVTLAGRRDARGLDLPGAALAVAGLVTLAYALAWAPAHGWTSVRTAWLLALAAALLAAFAAAEVLARRSGRQPLVPPQIWRSRPLVAGVQVMFASTGILVATFFLNTLYLQEVEHASALRVGLEFLPLALIIGLGAHLASHLLPRVGARWLIVAGLLLMAGGALLLTTVSARSGYAAGLLPGLLVIGLGTGLVLPATAVTGLSEVGDDRAGTASGLMSAAHEIGAAFGVAVFSAVAVVTSGGISAGYRLGFEVAAAIAAALAVLAAVTVPVVRPAAGARVAVH